MAQVQRCNECKWFVMLPQGECHLNPPSVFLVPGPAGGPVTVGVFPPTKPSNFCGKFEARIALES